MSQLEWAQDNSYEDALPAPDTFLNKIKRVVASVALFVTGYLLATLALQYSTGIMCRVFGYDPIITYNGIFNLPFDYHYWSFSRVLVIYSTGSVVSLLLGIIFFSVFSLMSGIGSLLRLMMLWISLCFFNILLGYLLFSPLGVEQYHSGLYAGAAIIGTWTRIGYLLLSPVALLAAAGSFMTGYLFAPEFLKFSYSRQLLEIKKERVKMLMQFYVLPVVVAAPALLLLTTTRSFPVHAFLYANLLIMGLGMYINVERGTDDVNVFRKDVLNVFPVAAFLISGSLYAAVWLYLR